MLRIDLFNICRYLFCVPLLLATDLSGQDTQPQLAPATSTKSDSAEIQTTQVLLGHCGVPPSAYSRLQTASRDIIDRGFEYPWKDLETVVPTMPGGKLRVLGYGSLLNRDSAARTIKNTPPEGHPPVLGIGARRVFNYLIPEERLKTYGSSPSSRERAALNVDYTQSPADVLNGRLLEIAPSDIAGLREREWGYDLRPVACVAWAQWESEPFIAFVLVAVRTEREGRSILDNRALPNPTYARLCRSGALAVSSAFLDLYLHTTWLADRRTLLFDWEKERPDVVEEPTSERR
jgi:hypothetical protein